jgi:hypothetical protein
MQGRSPGAILVLTLDEIRDVASVALRTRLEAHELPRATLASAIVVTVLLLTQSAVDSSIASRARLAPLGRIDFSAHDPAGQFTLTILNGKPVAATMNHVALPLRRVVHEGDSIRILSPNGHVALALAYYRESSRIEWKPRLAGCGAESGECRASQ